jgi:predicted Holliday junction resolvase-like endonuclease
MDVMIFFILLALIFGFILGFLIYKAVSKGKVLEMAEERAKEFFDRQKEELKTSIERDYKARFENWKRESKKAIKKNTLKTSRATLKGRIGEQMAPLLPIFEYNPADARFIGSPIDYVIFDKYTDIKDENVDAPITIIFMDVKTGKSAHLNPIQKKIKGAVESGCIKWKTLFWGDLSKFGEEIPKYISTGFD